MTNTTFLVATALVSIVRHTNVSETLAFPDGDTMVRREIVEDIHTAKWSHGTNVFSAVVIVPLSTNTELFGKTWQKVPIKPARAPLSAPDKVPLPAPLPAPPKR